MPDFDFQLLGPIEVRVDDVPLDLGGPRQRAVLAILMLDPNRVVSSDRLIGGVWGERPPASAAATLQSYVSRLRKALGAEMLVSSSAGYQLRTDPQRIDVVRFERLAETGRRALGAEAPQDAREALQEALSLWRGEPFGDLAYEAWAVPEATRLAELRAATTEDRVEADLALGRHAELIPELELLVLRYPLRERLRGQLMLALYRSERQAEALEAYQQARDALVEELGLDPGRSLQALEQAILRHDPALDLRATPAGAQIESGAQLVGREHELGGLRAAIESTLAGGGRLAVLTGEPGIGKTRLAEELARAAAQAGAVVVWGRCWEAGGAPPYWPWTQAMRHRIEQTDQQCLRELLGSRLPELAESLHELRRAFPDLGDPLPAEDFLDGNRFQLFEAATTFLRLVSSEQPTVIVLDDMHAADEPSLQLLRYLAPRLAELRVMVAFTYRDTDVEPWTGPSDLLNAISRHALPLLRLGGLADDAVGELVHATTGTEPSRQLVERLQEDTDGNPLFVAELARMLLAEKRLHATPQSRMRLPSGLRDVIARRLRVLSEGCREMLETASVIGREFDLPTLGRVASVEVATLLDAIDEAIAARIVVDVPDGLGRFRFAHALMRESIYDGLSPARRLLLHRRVGDVLEEIYAGAVGPHLGELAHHFFEAAALGEADKAVGYAERAARRALETLAFEEATRLYRLALRALELSGSADSVRTADDLLGLGESQARAGDLLESRSTFVRAAEVAREAGLWEQLGLAALGRGGRFVWGRGGVDLELVPLIEEALAGLGDEDSSLRARLLARLAGAQRDQASREPRGSISAEAVAIARRLGDPATLSYALESRWAAVWWPENPRERLEIADELVELAAGTRDRERAFEAHHARAATLIELGQPHAADVELEHVRRAANDLGQPIQQGMAVSCLATRALSEGRFEEAEALIARALTLSAEAEGIEAVVAHRIQLFMLRREQDRLHEVEGYLAAAALERSPRWVLACLIAHVHAALERPTEAGHALSNLGDGDLRSLPSDNEWLFSLSFLPEVCLIAGDLGRAEQLYRLLEPFADQIACDIPEGDVGSVRRPLGLLAAHLGRRRDAIAHLEAAVDRNDALGYRPWAAWSRLALGQVLLDQDDPGGRELLDHARATASELGMTALDRIAAQRSISSMR